MFPDSVEGDKPQDRYGPSWCLLFSCLGVFYLYSLGKTQVEKRVKPSWGPYRFLGHLSLPWREGARFLSNVMSSSNTYLKGLYL